MVVAATYRLATSYQIGLTSVSGRVTLYLGGCQAPPPIRGDDVIPIQIGDVRCNGLVTLLKQSRSDPQEWKIELSLVQFSSGGGVSPAAGPETEAKGLIGP